MPKSALRTSLHTLTASFADSVMAAIRSASLEDLLGEAYRDPGRPAGAPRSLKIARAPSSARPTRGGRARRSSDVDRPVLARAPESGIAVRRSDRPLPPTGAEITDPQGLLAMEAVERMALVERKPEREAPVSTLQAARAVPSVRLRANETLARVSNAGVVIRRIK